MWALDRSSQCVFHGHDTRKRHWSASLGFHTTNHQCFRILCVFSVNQSSLKNEETSFPSQTHKTKHVQDKKYAQFLYILTKFHVILIVYLFIFYFIYHLRKKLIMGTNFPGIWYDGLVVTLVWGFLALFFCHCSCLPFRNELGITFLIVCTKYKIMTVVIIEKKIQKNTKNKKASRA